MNRKKSMMIVSIVYSIAIISGLVLYYIMYRLSYDVLAITILVSFLMTIIVFIGSKIINNSSLYDPYWSVIPPFLVAAWYLSVGDINIHAHMIFFALAFWSIRLTKNWSKNFVGFKKEDFRYVQFRYRFKGDYWLVSFLGIHLFPTFIVLLSMYPIYIVVTTPITNNFFILLGSIVMVTGGLLSYLADKELYEHKQKNPTRSCRRGLWKYCRHPNYFGELTFWLGAYILSFGAGIYIDAMFGFIGMLLLFNFYSIPTMDKMLLYKLDDYEDVLQTVPRFFFKNKRNY